jgi:hypothetical protein
MVGPHVGAQPLERVLAHPFLSYVGGGALELAAVHRAASGATAVRSG